MGCLSALRTAPSEARNGEFAPALKIFSLFWDSALVAAAISFEIGLLLCPLILCIQRDTWRCPHVYDNKDINFR